MKLLGPDRFDLTFDARDFKVASTSGETQFTGRSAGRTPKLYVMSAQGRPFYVGVTTQPMRARLRLGFKADGSTGYHGYKWRHSLRRATLDIWYHPRPGSDAAFRDLETIEAEAVLVQREMERGRSPLVSVPPFGVGIVKAPRYTDSMRIWKQRKEQVPALPFIVSMSPPGYPSAPKSAFRI